MQEQRKKLEKKNLIGNDIQLILSAKDLNYLITDHKSSMKNDLEKSLGRLYEKRKEYEQQKKTITTDVEKFSKQHQCKIKYAEDVSQHLEEVKQTFKQHSKDAPEFVNLIEAQKNRETKLRELHASFIKKSGKIPNSSESNESLLTNRQLLVPIKDSILEDFEKHLQKQQVLLVKHAKIKVKLEIFNVKKQFNKLSGFCEKRFMYHIEDDYVNEEKKKLGEVCKQLKEIWAKPHRYNRYLLSNREGVLNDYADELADIMHKTSVKKIAIDAEELSKTMEIKIKELKAAEEQLINAQNKYDQWKKNESGKCLIFAKNYDKILTSNENFRNSLKIHANIAE